MIQKRLPVGQSVYAKVVAENCLIITVFYSFNHNLRHYGVCV